MEVLSKLSNGSIKRYWRRRRYQRLDGTNTGQKNVRLARFGGGRSNNKHFFWRIKAIPKLRFKIVSAPLKLWNKFKNGYMDMMLNLAGNVGHFNSGNVFGGKRIPKQRQVPLVYSSTDEFESRLIFEIYKALIASRELATMHLDTP